MIEITDEQMQSMLATSQTYSVVLLRPGAAFDGSSPLLWEHGRRNFVLRAEGLMPLVFRLTDSNDILGIGIFSVDKEHTRKLLQEDPAIKEGLFNFEIFESLSFPGDRLP